jgi:hypothetical protein
LKKFFKFKKFEKFKKFKKFKKFNKNFSSLNFRKNIFINGELQVSAQEFRDHFAVD